MVNSNTKMEKYTQESGQMVNSMELDTTKVILKANPEKASGTMARG